MTNIQTFQFKEEVNIGGEACCPLLLDVCSLFRGLPEGSKEVDVIHCAASCDGHPEVPCQEFLIIST